MSLNASHLILGSLLLLTTSSSGQTEMGGALLPAFDGKQYGFIDDGGKVAIRFGYDNVGQFSEGLAAVLSRGGWGYIDRQGRWVISPAFAENSRFSEGLAAVEVSPTGAGFAWEYIDTMGKVVIPPRFLKAEPFSEGLAVVGRATRKPEQGILYGYINKSGDYVVRPRFLDAKPFSQGLAAVVEPSEDGYRRGEFIDRSGDLVIPGPFGFVDSFSEGLASVEGREGKYGYIDRSGRLVIEYKFDRAWQFADGVAKVRIGANYGFIDKSGHFVVGEDIPELKYREASAFSNGVAAVFKPATYDPLDKITIRESGLIDKHGKLLVYYPLSRAEVVAPGIFLIRHSVFGWVGYMNSKGAVFYRFPPESRCRYCLFFTEGALEKREKIKLRSKPIGATVYLLPKWDFPKQSDLPTDEKNLEMFKFPYGPTNTECKLGCIDREKYWAVFSLRGQKCILPIDIVHGEDHDYFCQFPECAGTSPR